MFSRGWRRVSRFFEQLHHALGVLHYISVILLGLGATLAFKFSDLLLTIGDIANKPTGPDAGSLLAVSVATLIGWLVAIVYFFRSAHWRRKSLKRGDRLRRLEAVASSFRKLADYHSECDKELFDLFQYEIAKEPMPKDPVDKALGTVGQNIDRVLDFAVNIFTELTAHQCATCLKLVEIESIGSASEVFGAQVRTFRRDTSSRIDRKRHDIQRTEYVRDTSSDEFIFTRENDGVFRNDIWACDDLESLFSKGEYKNNRKSWRQDYNATIVCGIRNLGPQEDIAWRALFCVDNLEGGLDNEMAYHYAREMSARLSVLIYRQSILQSSRE